MAKLKITPFQNPDLSRLVEDIGTNPVIEELSGITMFAFRAKIILDRNIRGFEKIPVKGPSDGFETSGLPIMATENQDRENAIKRSRVGRNQDASRSRDEYLFEKNTNVTSDNALDITKKNTLVDNISIVDIDFQPSHTKDRGYSTITLPFVPREVSYNPSSKFIGIATMGRNNPHYHYTGSEDTISFEIDWFAKYDDRTDVINSCRWVEALTKSDGYKDIPHRVKLVWGIDDKLFQDDVWLVTDAPYVLSEFQKGYRDPISKNIVRLGMMPQQAKQTVTLKRLTVDNRTTREIIGKLAKI